MAREFAKKFYHSKEWKRIRDIAFERDKGLCQKCLIEKGEHVPGEEVHHIIWLRPSNINDPNITLNLDNLITLCKDCHINLHKNSTHRRKTHTVMNGTYIDEQGQIQKQKIIIVHGAPASGKTTYVHKHREPGDLIVDLDAIKDAISRYIYTALQGGSIMHGWMNDDKVMITCCNDGTRPVIFKIERIDCE